MPSPLPTSFSSAAAGNANDSSSAPSRRGDSGSGEWGRHRSNGATQTFRRPSVATNQSHTRDSVLNTPSATTPSAGAYVPPHLNSSFQPGSARGSGSNDCRYSKKELLNFFTLQDVPDVTPYFLAEWNPLQETPTANGSWSKRHDFKDYNSGPEVCWDHSGQTQPLGLMDLTEEEKTMFSTTVNSPLKPPPQKEGATGGGGTARKTSISHSQSHIGNFNASSPGSARPGVRRRGTGDSSGHTMSPTSNNRFSRDEPSTTGPPPSLLRRKTDFRDGIPDSKYEEKGKDRDSSADMVGSLKRSATNPLSVSGSTSPWTTASPSSTGTGFSSSGGAFGNFSIGGPRSRFRDLMSTNSASSANSAEDLNSPAREKSAAAGGLDRLPEADDDGSHQFAGRLPQTRSTRSDTNPFDETGSVSSARIGSQNDGASAGIDQFGLSSFGLQSNPSNPSGLRDFMSSSQHPLSRASHNEPMSPAHTNPYQSPHMDQHTDAEDIDTDGSEIQNVHLPDIDGLHDNTGNVSLGYMQKGNPIEGSAGDRSQTSSIGAGRGFGGLGGLGALPSLSSPGGWPPVSTATGTPTRERSAFPSGFGDPIFGGMGDMHSPSLSTLGSGGFFGSHGAGFSGPPTSRPSKLGSLFPPAMQDQMRGEQREQQRHEPIGGQEGDGMQYQEHQGHEMPHSLNPPPTGPPQSTSSTAPGQPPMSSGQDGTSQAPQSSGGAPLPTTQQRQMVMPDRMRWIYRDPAGNVQGPWSGLEMHDWFKAGFFTADLQVKKLEDAEYEPLAQLVRRIGNSREPFLVPQIGVPHGPPQQQPWTGTSGPNGGVQPPFPSSFPSFGTTLTAEQQNALERRKQEEQYLMARQKEHLAQHQALMKQAPLPGGAPPILPLQHHASAHSLHSQPSYGSITSPGGFQPVPLQAPIQPPPPPHPMPGFFDTPIRQNTVPNLAPQMNQPDALGGPDPLPGFLDRLNINVNRSAQFPYGSAAPPPDHFHMQAVSTMLQDRARLQQEQAEYDLQNQHDSIFDQQAREERLRQFQAVRPDEEVPVRRLDGLAPHSTEMSPADEMMQAEQQSRNEVMESVADQMRSDEATMSLSQQVQKAASAQRLHQQEQHPQPSASSRAESPWKVEAGMPMPFPPPPPSGTPLPAPAAQRNRQHVADALAAESMSDNQTSVEAQQATSIAPWARDTSEAPKGPSLKEIQEAEARQAAKLEEATAAARRALAEQERANQPPPAAPGLPSTANWASQPNAAPTTASAWMKPLAGKAPLVATQAPKKTLAQIQKEEEARKQRQAAMAASIHAASSTPTPTSVGKRYADLAGKATPPSSTPSVASTGAWTTVGAGGKPKPIPPTAAAPQRSMTSATAVSTVAKPRPMAAPMRSATMGAPASANQSRATDELAKWAKMSLGRGLNSSINVDDFVQQLLLLPAETDIISDSIYANSQTLDGRRFAEEFIRRRKLADKGVVEAVAATNVGSFGPPASNQKPASDGWNEVAKKGPVAASAPREDANAAFKVVASKKKGKR